MSSLVVVANALRVARVSGVHGPDVREPEAATCTVNVHDAARI